MKPELIIGILAVILFLFLIFLIVSIIADVNKKKRFSNNTLIKNLTEELMQSMLTKIRQAKASDHEAYKVSLEVIRVSDDSIMSYSGSIFFRHEHLRLLITPRERKLMAQAIAEGLKNKLRSQLPPCDPTNGLPYKLNIEYKREMNGKNYCTAACVYYTVANEDYIETKKW